MKIEIRSDEYASKEDALNDFVARGLWPLSQAINEGAVDEPHWHNWDTHLYIVSGTYEVVDPTDGSITAMAAGDSMFVPARTLHGGRMTSKGTLVLGLSQPINFDEKINYTADEL